MGRLHAHLTICHDATAAVVSCVDGELQRLVIAIVIGLAFTAPAYFFVSVLRRSDAQCTKWQRTCTLAFFSYVVLIVMAVLMLGFAPWPFGMLALILLALCGFARIHFMRIAINH